MLVDEACTTSQRVVPARSTFMLSNVGSTGVAPGGGVPALSRRPAWESENVALDLAVCCSGTM